MSAFNWSGVYIILFNTLSGGKSCLIAPGVAVPPWTTETLLSPLVGGWWGQGIASAFTRCMMKKKKHRQTDCFVVSHLFSVVRDRRWSKLGSKPGWLYDSRIFYYTAKQTQRKQRDFNVYVSLLVLFTYEVPSIRFQTFFCKGIWNCLRLLKIMYVIAIHLMRWLTNFYDFRLK